MNDTSMEQLELFDLRDRDWELASWSENSFAVWVTEPDVLAGEFAGKQISKALVTFRGVRLEQAITREGEEERSLTYPEAMARFARYPMFVFSYYLFEKGCELCGISDREPLALIFEYDSVTVQWDAFASPPVGRLLRT